jgi:hypothetical protein
MLALGSSLRKNARLLSEHRLKIKQKSGRNQKVGSKSGDARRQQSNKANNTQTSQTKTKERSSNNNQEVYQCSGINFRTPCSTLFSDELRKGVNVILGPLGVNKAWSSGEQIDVDLGRLFAGRSDRRRFIIFLQVSSLDKQKQKEILIMN